MRPLVTALAVVVAALAVGTTATASRLPTTGVAIRLLNPAATPATFAAETPFHVRHGFVCVPEERALCLDPKTEFRLYVDGQRMPSMHDLEFRITCPSGESTSNECTNRGNLTNFRSGLPAGAHTFRGEWWVSGELTIVREATIEFVG